MLVINKLQPDWLRGRGHVTGYIVSGKAFIIEIKNSVCFFIVGLELHKSFFPRWEVQEMNHFQPNNCLILNRCQTESASFPTWCISQHACCSTLNRLHWPKSSPGKVFKLVYIKRRIYGTVLILKLLALGKHRQKTFNLYVVIVATTPFFTVWRLRSVHISHFFISVLRLCAPELTLHQLCVKQLPRLFVSDVQDILSHLLLRWGKLIWM